MLMSVISSAYTGQNSTNKQDCWVAVVLMERVFTGPSLQAWEFLFIYEIVFILL